MYPCLRHKPPCDRKEPKQIGAPDQIRTDDPLVRSGKDESLGFCFQPHSRPALTLRWHESALARKKRYVSATLCRYLHVYASIDIFHIVDPSRPKPPQLKPLEFLGSSRDDLAAMPASVRHDIGVQLMRVQFGSYPTDFKPIPAVGVGVYEIRVRDASGAYRAMYVAKFEVAVYVLHAFQKKTQQTAKTDIELGKARYKLIGAKL